MVPCILWLFATACITPKNSSPTVELKDKAPGLPRTDTLLAGLLQRHAPYLDSLLRQNEKWRIQIIYTQIDRKADNQPVLTHHYYGVDPAAYFYPASTVKMPAAILALQRLNELNKPGLHKYTTLVHEAGGRALPGSYNDPGTADGRPTVAHYIKKIFLVSDNDAYNRLYEFLGQEYLNQTLHRMGYDSVQLLHRLEVALTEEQNRYTNAVRFIDSAGNTLCTQPAVHSQLPWQGRQQKMGTGYLRNGQVVKEPFDFSAKNRFPLPDLHSILQSVVFPESVAAKQRFKLTSDDYRFLYQYMSMLPRESRFPSYDGQYPDGYVKFLLFGGGGAITDTALRIFNKVGDAYGFLTDVAYVADFANGIEFMLSATIYCNSDGIFNDDKYDYDSVGFPFLKKLGEVIYAHEAKRKKQHPPDFSRFRVNYDDN